MIISACSIRPTSSNSEPSRLVHALTSSRPDCCNSLYLCKSQATISRQNAAARLLTKSKRQETHHTPFQVSLDWLPVHFRIKSFKLVLSCPYVYLIHFSLEPSDHPTMALWLCLVQRSKKRKAGSDRKFLVESDDAFQTNLKTHSEPILGYQIPVWASVPRLDGLYSSSSGLKVCPVLSHRFYFYSVSVSL